MQKAKARVICNPTSGGGAYDPDEIREELDGMELDWIQTEGSEDAIGAAEEWSEGLLLVRFPRRCHPWHPSCRDWQRSRRHACHS